MAKRQRLTDMNTPVPIRTKHDDVLDVLSAELITDEQVDKLAIQPADSKMKMLPSSQNRDTPDLQAEPPQLPMAQDPSVTGDPASEPESSKSESQQDKNKTSQQVDKLVIRKATFQLSGAVLERLDRFHLQLQLSLGKANTPYKEVIVEEAIAQMLDYAEKHPTEAIDLMQQRQARRN